MGEAAVEAAVEAEAELETEDRGRADEGRRESRDGAGEMMEVGQG